MEIRTCEEYVLDELNKRELELSEMSEELSHWKDKYWKLVEERDDLYNENLWYKNNYGERVDEPKRGC